MTRKLGPLGRGGSRLALWNLLMETYEVRLLRRGSGWQ